MASCPECGDDLSEMGTCPACGYRLPPQVTTDGHTDTPNRAFIMQGLVDLEASPGEKGPPSRRKRTRRREVKRRARNPTWDRRRPRQQGSLIRYCPHEVIWLLWNMRRSTAPWSSCSFRPQSNRRRPVPCRQRIGRSLGAGRSGMSAGGVS